MLSHTTTRKRVGALLSLLLLAPSLYGQVFDLGSDIFLDYFLTHDVNRAEATVQDGYNYLGAYMAPIGNAMIVGNNNGWYSSAGTHKALGFDIRSSLNVVMVPAELTRFDPADLNWQVLQTNETSLPNILGDNNCASCKIQFPLEHEGQTYVLDEYDAFTGLGGLIFDPGASIPVPIPTLNLSIGTIKNTDLSFRILGLPNSSTRPFNFLTWGVGVKHDIKQWIPRVKDWPFDMAVQLGYTNSMATLSTILSEDEAAGITISNQAFTGQLLLSKKILFFTPYAGVGFNYGSNATALHGEVTLNGLQYDPANPDTPIELPNTFDLSTFAPVENQLTGLRATVGGQFKIWKIILFGDYTFASNGYNVISVGSGISIR